MNKRFIATLAAVIVLFGLLTGCKDGSKLKEDVQQALTKQSQMKNYQFSGHADVNLGVSLNSSSTNPLMIALLSSLKQSRLDWSGVASTEPLQLEADVKITPAGSTASFDLPIIIKDNKLYINIPLISKKDEYFVIDLQQKTSENLKNTVQISTDISNLLFGGIDAKWYKEDSVKVKLKDGKSAKSIAVNIDDSNQKEIAAALEAIFPQIVDVLQKGSVIASDQADQWKQHGNGTLQLHAPGHLSLSIDDQGFIREQHVSLHYSVSAQDGSVSDNQVELEQTYNEINQNPKFSKEIPTQTKSFDEILNLLNGIKK